jgi:hypothetical protein
MLTVYALSTSLLFLSPSVFNWPLKWTKATSVKANFKEHYEINHVQSQRWYETFERPTVLAWSPYNNRFFCHTVLIAYSTLITRQHLQSTGDISTNKMLYGHMTLYKWSCLSYQFRGTNFKKILLLRTTVSPQERTSKNHWTLLNYDNGETEGLRNAGL